MTYASTPGGGVDNRFLNGMTYDNRFRAADFLSE